MQLSPSTPAVAVIAKRMDALSFTRLHLLMIILLGLALLFDQMEAQMSTVLTAVFSEPGSAVGRAEFSRMLLLYYIVAAIGAPVMGIIADRFGRRISLMAMLCGFGILSISAVLMPDFGSFAIFRIASSFAMSAVPALAFSFIADTLPPRARGSMMMLVSLCSGTGAALAPLVTRWGNNVEPFGFAGWEAAMIIAASAGIVLSAACWLLPESPRWLMGRGRPDEAERALACFERSRVVKRLLQSPPTPQPASRDAAPEAGTKPRLRAYRGRLIVVLVTMFLQSCGMTGFAMLLTKALIMKGQPMQAALAQSSLVLLMMPIGVLLAATIADRMPRRTLYVSLSLIGATAAFLFGAVGQQQLLLVAACLFAFVMGAHMSIGQIYCAEMFPTQLRGTAMGAGYGAIRTGSAFVPILMLPLLFDFGPTTAFWTIAGFMLAAAVIMRLFGPDIRPGLHLN